MTLRGEFEYAAICVLASGIFDFLDGMIARLLQVKSAIGKELDSLADMVSFGFLPGAILFMLLGQVFATSSNIPYLGFVVTVFSGLRLAKFNIDDRQSTDFIGLNTPMNTFYVLSLPFIAQTYPNFILNPYFLLISIGLSSYLLISEIPLFSMKFSSLSWAANRFKYIFLGLALLLVITLQFTALPIILLLYFGLSALHFRRLA